MGYSLIVIGVSAGGLHALCELLSRLPRDFSVPIAIVQHRAKDSVALAGVLQECASRQVVEIEDKMPLDWAPVMLAPPDYHVLVDGDYFSLSTEAPVTYSRPSIDVLFESAADSLGSAAIGIVLTGANRDGSRGLQRIWTAGGGAIVQDPETAEVAVMPRAALELVPDAVCASVQDIPARIEEMIRDNHRVPRSMRSQ